MRATVQKWGNSLAIRIPKAFAEDTRLRQGTEVEMTQQDGKLVVVPVSRPVYKLSELLAKVTPKNLHKSVDWGKPRGKEIW